MGPKPSQGTDGDFRSAAVAPCHKIPTPQIWMLVAYVRSLSALNTTGARSSRADHMMMYPGSNSLQDPAKPKQSFHPPARLSVP